MKKLVLACLFFVFVLQPVFTVFSQERYSNEAQDTTSLKEMVKGKIVILEELIEDEVLISEFYDGDYHLTLKKAIEFTDQAKEYIKNEQYEAAIKKIEIAEDLAKKVMNIANGESNDLKDRTENRMRQLDILFEYSNKLYYNNNFSNVSVKLKELFKEAKITYEKAKVETKRKEYVSAQDSISFAMDCLLGATKLSVDELLPEIDGMMKERIAEVDELIKDGMESVPQSGDEGIEWYFNQGLKYRDSAEKDMRKDFVQSYTMIQLSKGYCNMALKRIKEKGGDSLFVVPSSFEQKRIEDLEVRYKKEYDLLRAYEKLWNVKKNLSYQDSLVERTIKGVNGSSDYILRTRLKRLLDFRKSAEISSLLDENKLLATFQFAIAKFSYKLLELSKSRVKK